MDTAAIYHRPESEYAFLYTNTNSVSGFVLGRMISKKYMC